MHEANRIAHTRENPNPQNAHFSKAIHVFETSSTFSRGRKGCGYKPLQKFAPFKDLTI